MEAFTMQIAGLTARVQPLFASTREYCRSYLSNVEPEFQVQVTQTDLIYEQKMAEIEALEEGLRIRKFTEPFLERATIQRKIATELLNRKTILLHGSTVGVDGAAYLFVAPCGTGKSTHTRFWRETFGSRAVMVNDDKTFLQITDSGIYAYGSPWSGKHGLATNICLPLKGICFLQRGSDNSIHSVDAVDVFDELVHQTFVPEEPNLQINVKELLNALSQQIDLWKMECNLDPMAAQVAYDAMSNRNV